MIELLSIQNIVWQVNGYQLSLIEAVGIISGLLSVYLAVRKSYLTWTIGLINEAAFLIIFYQVRLYSEMALQLFFVILTLYGWCCWTTGEGEEVKPSVISNRERLYWVGSVIWLTVILGIVFSHIHLIAPRVFPQPALFPYLDGFTAAASMIAIYLLAQQALESWLLWISVDLVSIHLFCQRGIPFMALLYAIFLGLAIKGLSQWINEFTA